jgi:hypothetical protein
MASAGVMESELPTLGSTAKARFADKVVLGEMRLISRPDR